MKARIDRKERRRSRKIQTAAKRQKIHQKVNIIELVNDVIDRSVKVRDNFLIFRSVFLPECFGGNFPETSAMRDGRVGHHYYFSGVSKELNSAVICRLKIMANMSISVQNKIQRGDFQRRVGNSHILVKAVCIPLPEGEMMVLDFCQTDRPYVVEAPV